MFCVSAWFATAQGPRLPAWSKGSFKAEIQHAMPRVKGAGLPLQLLVLTCVQKCLQLQCLIQPWVLGACLLRPLATCSAAWVCSTAGLNRWELGDPGQQQLALRPCGTSYATSPVIQERVSGGGGKASSMWSLTHCGVLLLSTHRALSPFRLFLKSGCLGFLFCKNEQQQEQGS